MKRDQAHHELLASLFRELFQTEASAELHCRREARRVNGAPAAALEAAAVHAAAVADELRALARAEQLPDRAGGRLVGRVLSRVLDLVTDRLLDRERSYRATLLGLRHGLDLVRMIRLVADRCGRVAIGGFCTRWLAAREPVVEQVDHAMGWFARHPSVARETLGLRAV